MTDHTVRIEWDRDGGTVRLTCLTCPTWKAAVHRPETGPAANRATFTEVMAIKDAHEARSLVPGDPGETATAVDRPASHLEMDVLYRALADWPVTIR